jgi:mannose-6-phosphate isomerase-like protein (cupin superfamily)
MNRYTVGQIDTLRRETKEPWIEFQRSSDLSTGLYVLEVGEIDEQVPHTEDEIYVAVAGRARFETPGGTVEVEPGTVLFVPANEEHRFIDVTETLQLVVVFGPAEGSLDQ